MPPLLAMFHAYITGEQSCFPIVVSMWNRVHSQEMVRVILEHERCNRAGRCKPCKPSQTVGFAVNALGIAEPGDSSA
ncbi:MAG: hypothetical protein AVDCRST_MAG93-7797 [uncultured Chloroflexia bacterium]|uniref:Uncharacterized protein n=1 Tax=uncultured Chloroflexia bacterium TaxID=1672391 RepID=A0A6J4MSQ4_9CHLR|nr:MAG: hypothetical protein AVDCRST_MAG93-7797 [uncultured Chloroflexia bacterium]